MLNDLIQQLNSPDAEVRKRAVKALGRAKDPGALKALAAVYRTDSDAEVRDLAFKAGRYIRSMTGEMDAAEPEFPRAAPPPPAPVSPIDKYSTTTAPRATEEVEYVPTNVSPRDVEKARGYFNLALDYNVRHEEVKALEALGKAIDTNPNLRNDTMAVNLAMEMTGLGSNAAFRLMSDPAARREFIIKINGGMLPSDIHAGDDVIRDPAGSKIKRDAIINHDPEQTWRSALLDIGVYGLVNGAIVFVAVLIGFQALASVLVGAASGSGTFNSSTLPVTASLGAAALYGLLYGVFSMIGLLILDGAVHLVASTVMGGDGSLVRLIHKTTLFYTITTGISTLMSVLPILFINDSTILPVFTLISFIVAVGMLIWAGKLTGEAYRFDTTKGCLSMFLGTLVLWIGGFCVGFAFSSTILQFLSGVAGV